MAALTPPQDDDRIVELTDLIERGPLAPETEGSEEAGGTEMPAGPEQTEEAVSEETGETAAEDADQPQDTAGSGTDASGCGEAAAAPEKQSPDAESSADGQDASGESEDAPQEAPEQAESSTEAPVSEDISAAPAEEAAESEREGTPAAAETQPESASQQAVSPLVAAMLPGIADKVGGLMEKVFHMEDRIRGISERLAKVEQLRTAQAAPDPDAVNDLVQKETSRLISDQEKQSQAQLDALKEKLATLGSRLSATEQSRGDDALQNRVAGFMKELSGEIGDALRAKADKAVSEKLAAAVSGMEGRAAELAASLDAHAASVLDAGQNGAGQEQAGGASPSAELLDSRISETVKAEASRIEAEIQARAEQSLQARVSRLYDTLSARFAGDIETKMQELAAGVSSGAAGLKEEISAAGAKELEDSMSGLRENLETQVQAASEKTLREAKAFSLKNTEAVSALEEQLGKLAAQQQELAERLNAIEQAVSGPSFERACAAACARILREELQRLLSGGK